MNWRQIIKKSFNAVGLELLRVKNVPRETFFALGGQPIDTILDVGANDGGFVRWISPRMPGVRIHCFEPLPTPARTLAQWAAREKLNVAVHSLALSDAPGEARFLEHVDHSTSSSMLPVTDKSRELFPDTSRAVERVVQMNTLDAWAGSLGPEKLGRVLLKLDVQGFEDRVLRGATRTLEQVDICIAEVSIVGLYQGQARFIDIATLLAAAGLEYFGNLEQFHDESGAPIFLDAVFVRSSVRGGSPQ